MNKRKVVKKIGLRTGKWAAVLLLLSVLFVQQTVLAAPPVYGNQATAVSATDVTTLTINRPANTAANDLLLAAIATDGSRTIAAPTGWTIINRGNSGGEVSLAVFYKIATGTEPGNYAFTWTGGEQATGTIMRYTGVNPSSPINTSGFGTGTSNAPTAPTVTTTTAETMVVRIFATDDDDNPFAFPTGYSGRVMLESSATDFSVSLGLADVQQVAAGATGTAAFGMGATEEWRAVTVALNRLSTAPIANQVKGVVFRDYNADGVNDIAEPGVAGITITAYGASGAAVDADTTDANGNYTLTGLTDSVAYRLEMTGLPDYLQPGSVGIDSNTSVVFVTSPATNVQFGVFNPADYCQNNPNMTTPCYYNGNPTGTGTTSTSSFLYSFPYNAANTTPSPTTLAQGGEIGATYGLAYQRSTGQLFAAAMMKRHVGYGPAGSGGIYIIDDPTGTPSSSLFVNLATLGLGYSFGSTSHTNLPNDAVTPNHDGSITNNNDVFDAVGKESFGDMDISEDETTLYLVDLTNRALLSIFIDMPAQVPDASDVTSYSIPDPGCTNGGYRPWALKVQDGLVYVGVVCDQFSATASNPDAFVYTFNPATTGFTQIFSMDLQYTRGYVSSGAPTPSANWRPWISQWSSIWHLGTGLPYGKQVSHPQAILADIEFDNDGSMILGFMDRFGHQSGAANYSTNLASTTRYEGVAAGDLIKACLVNGSYIVESNGSCGGVITTGVGNNQGPGGGEFYWQDMHAVSTNPTAGTHTETTIGSLAMLRGEDEVAVTVWDPINNVMAGGIGWYNNTAGTHPRGYEIYRSITTPDNSDSRLFGKANGLGDLEVLCDPAPVEIGNRIWDDTDRDGIQDPTESGLSGIVVQLYADTTNDGIPDTKVAETTTDANGRYLFSQAGTNAYGVAENWSFSTPNNITMLTAYEIRVDTTQLNLSGRGLTVPNSDGQTDNNSLTDVRDSDATLNNSNAAVLITTGGAGNNNHSLDFGFTTNATADYGDLPDSFDTTTAQSGSAHTVSANLFLGSCVDAEVNGQPDTEAGMDGTGGDDNNVSGGVTGTCTGNDDEDGIRLITPLVAGNQACVAVTAVNTTGSAANLYGFIDYNGDGDFDSDADNLLTGVNFGAGVASVPNGGVNGASYCFNVPASATFDGGETHLRFRLTSNTLTGNLWAGTATNGEVEDYYNQLTCVGNYMWFDTGTTANVQDAGDTAVANGTPVNLIWGGPNGVIGTGGDDVTYTTTTGSGGNYSFCGLLPDANGTGGADEYQIIVPNAPGVPVTAGQGGNVALDSNGTASGNNANGPVFTLPTANMNNDTASNDANPNNYPGAQTDLSIDFGFIPSFDWGDLPDTTGGTAVGDYQTLFANNGPLHLMRSATYLGACVDGEANGLQNLQAGLTGAGDDGSTGSPVRGTCATAGDDEDGVTWTSVLMAGRPASFTVSTSGNSCLSVFIDFNNDGTLDAVSTNGNSPTSPNTAMSDMVLTGSGPHAFQINIPGTASGVMYSRFRLTATCGEGGASATGFATSGEVEDYVLAAIGDTVWQDTNVNGIQDAGETNCSNTNGLLVNLLDSAGNAVMDAGTPPTAITTTVDSSCRYSFPGVFPGANYKVGFTAPVGYGFSPTTQGNNATVDSNANVFTGQTDSFSVAPATTDNSWDAGIYQVTNPSVGNRVWQDANNNGSMESGEVGIDNAPVRLYVDTGNNGPDASDVAGAPVAAFLTDSEGYYIFPNVAPAANYFICVDAALLGNSSGAPIGGHPPSDTEEDGTGGAGDDGVPLGTGMLVCSQVFAVVANGQPTDDLVNPIGYTNNNADMKVDFGFTSSPTAVTLQSFNANNNIAIPIGLVIIMISILVAGSFIIIRRRKVMG